MEWKDLHNIESFITAGLNSEIQDDEEARLFVVNCLKSYFDGSQGETSEEGKAANVEELKAGQGRIVTKWKTPAGLSISDDLYIITYFDEEKPGDIDYNNTLVMLCSDY